MDAEFLFGQRTEASVFGMLFQYNQGAAELKHAFHCFISSLSGTFDPSRFVIGFTVSPLLHHHHAVHGSVVAIGNYFALDNFLAHVSFTPKVTTSSHFNF